MKIRPVIWEMVRFGIVGVGCTLLHYALYYLLQLCINVNVAYTLGYVLSFVANFYLTSYFTFGSTPSWKKLFGMAGAHGVNYLLHMLFLMMSLTQSSQVHMVIQLLMLVHERNMINEKELSN